MAAITYHPAPISLASSLLKFQISKASSKASYPARLLTSCASIDTEALDGGFSYGSITSLSGSSATGKTLIAMHALVTHLLAHPESQAAWVDSLGTFSPARLRQVIIDRAQGVTAMGVNNVLDRVQIMRVFDMYGVIEAMDELNQGHKERRKEKDRSTRIIVDSEGEESDEEISQKGEVENFGGVRVLVVDTISQPISSMMNKGRLQGHGLLMSFSRSLSLLARDKHICVLLLNTAVSQPLHLSVTTPQIYNPYPSAFASTSTKPALGISYAYCADLNLLLSKHPRNCSDAEDAARGATEWNEDVVLEVLSDRGGARVGLWGAFTIDGTKLNSGRAHA